MLHGLADHAVTHAMRLGLLYRGGFGDRALLARIMELIESYARTRPLGEVRMREASRRREVANGTVHEATFETPALTPLPDCARTARVQIWTPRHHGGAVCIVLAATAEEGFFTRAPLARQLVAEGIGAVLLENPFYGRRRPAGQLGPVLRTVADQLAMSTATVDEARALLGWARDAGYTTGITGFSHGGFMASFAAALVDFPVVLVARGSGTHAGPVLTEGPLQRAVHWRALEREAGSLDAAREELRRCLRGVDLRLHGPPIDPRLATVLVGRNDLIFASQSGLALHQHWPGSHLVLSNAGHITSVLLDDVEHARAVLRAFGRAGVARLPPAQAQATPRSRRSWWARPAGSFST